MSNLLQPVAQVQEWHLLDSAQKQAALSGAEPVVVRGLVSHWPIVVGALESASALEHYVLGFDAGKKIQAMFAMPAEQGRLFYGETLDKFNFERMDGYFRDAFTILAALSKQTPSPAFYIGSTSIAEYLPGMEKECRLSFLADDINPNIWIGNRTLVATHNDALENIACVAAGRRLFTLFPPAQKDNLYIADTELSPGGRPISLVNLKAPDFARFPRFASALSQAKVALLNPGDALYLPANWWHNVEALDAINILVNFWWPDTPPRLPISN